MALEPFHNNGQWYLTADAPLGRFYWRVGPHFLGIDDSFQEPIIARAYYDPSQDTHRPGRAGYIQSVQVYFDGVPVPPEAYGGHLTARAPYAGDEGFVDFMAPAAARAQGRPHPFYAYNGPHNGVLLTADGTHASLVAAIFPGHLTSDHLTELLRPGSVLRTIRCTPEDLTTRGAHPLAADALAELRGLACTAVGPYFLVEGPGSAYCLHPNPAGTEIAVYELRATEVDALRGFATLDALDRMAEHAHTEVDVDTVVADLDQTLLPALAPIWVGRETLPAEPRTFDPNQFTVEWRYTTYLVAESDGSLTPLHGFTWSLCQEFDPGSRRLTPTAVTGPRFLRAFPGEALLDRYYRAVDRSGEPIIDSSEFAAAGLPRPVWATGRKLDGIDVDGRPTSTGEPVR